MNKARVYFGIALVVITLVSIPAFSQQAPPTQAPKAAAAEKTLSGPLVKVDTAAKVISVKGPDQKDMLFTYSEETQVISPDKTVQGLSGKTGAQLKISYIEDRGTNMATKIELVEAEKK
jgi:hypothetical protein